MESPVYIHKPSLSLLLLNICGVTEETGRRLKETLAFKESLRNVKLGAGSPLSPPSLAALWHSFAVSHRRFIMLVHQSLQSKPHSCFCHLSVGNKRERGESKENISPPSRAWDNGCEKRVGGRAYLMKPRDVSEPEFPNKGWGPSKASSLSAARSWGQSLPETKGLVGNPRNAHKVIPHLQGGLNLQIFVGICSL